MSKKELLTELKGGASHFVLVGTAKVTDGSFGGAKQKEGSNWLGVNSSFGVEISEGNVIYPVVRGGYMLDNPVLKRFGKDRESGMVTINYDRRHDEALLDNIAPSAFKRGALVRGDDKKPVLERFIDDIDYEEYLANNLSDGMEIRVVGRVEYSEGTEERIYRNYTVSGVYLNEAYQKNGVEVEPAPHSAEIQQTYIFEAGAVEDSWKKSFKETGQFTVKGYVPQYVSKRLVGGNYIEFKKTMPLKQVLYIKGNPEDEKSNSLIENLATKLFNVKRGTVRELSINCAINEGYEVQNGNFTISKEMQALIDLGLISEEEVKKTANVRGQRVSELIFKSPMTTVDDKGEISFALDDNKYDESALFVPDVDSSEDEEEESENVYGTKEEDSDISNTFEDFFSNL